jgi:hypothetical protein
MLQEKLEYVRKLTECIFVFLRGGAVLLVCNDLFNTHRCLDRDHDLVFSTRPSLTDLVGQRFGKGGEIQIRLLIATFIHQGELIAVNVNNFPFRLIDNGDHRSMRRRNHILQFFARENINGGKVALGVAVLSSLGHGNIQHLARLSLDHHKAE